MLAVLSPAKSLNPEPVALDVAPTQPAMMKEAEMLMRTARGLSQKKIRELMNISPDLAKLNYDRYRSFELPFDEDNALPAALTFDGDVYKGLDARSLSEADLAWAQDHVAILSGMFGVLRPLDLIQPYRLEMGTKLPTRRGKNLYQFWGDGPAEHLRAQLEHHEDPTLVNLASQEYFKAVKTKSLGFPVVECVFHDWKQGKEPNVVSFFAKRARGQMARFMIEERVDTVEGLKDFAVDRYRFQPKTSDEGRLVFGRPFRSAAS